MARRFGYRVGSKEALMLAAVDAPKSASRRGAQRPSTICSQSHDRARRERACGCASGDWLRHRKSRSPRPEGLLRYSLMIHTEVGRGRT